MNRSFWKVTLFFLVLAGVPSMAWANAGTILVQSAFWHMVVGNAIIGVGEGIFLKLRYKDETQNAIPLMIGANYVSAWVGGLGICGWVAHSVSMDLSNAWLWYWRMIGLSYLVTLALEWPFVARCFRGVKHRWRRSVGALLLVQTISYVLLFGWYWLVGSTSLYTKTTVVEPSAIGLPADVAIYYIGKDDGHVHRWSLATGSDEMVYSLGSTNAYDRLTIQPAQLNSNLWDLVALLDASRPLDRKTVTVVADLDVLDVLANPTGDLGHAIRFGPVPQLGSATNSAWQFKTWFWATPGLTGENLSTGERVQLGWETLYSMWSPQNAVHLPSDKILFQLKHDQICVYDPVTKRVALLCRGRGPLAVIQKSTIAYPPRTAGVW